MGLYFIPRAPPGSLLDDNGLKFLFALLLVFFLSGYAISNMREEMEWRERVRRAKSLKRADSTDFSRGDLHADPPKVQVEMATSRKLAPAPAARRAYMTRQMTRQASLLSLKKS